MARDLLSHAVRRFLAWANDNLAEQTVDGYRRYLGNFVNFAGDIPVTKISPALVGTFSRKFHPVQAVQRLAGWLHREERSILVNPLAGMRKRLTGQRRRILSREEMMHLLRNTDHVFRPFLLAMRETFARPQEIRVVTPSHIYEAGGMPATPTSILAGRAFFLLEGAKGYERRAEHGRIRIIPISPRLGRLLMRLIARGVEPSEPLFRNKSGLPWNTDSVRNRMRRLRVRADVGVDARGERVVCYSFRHTGATSAAKAGMRDWTLAEVLGHASTRTTARYVHMQAEDVLGAMQRLWEINAKPPAESDRTESPRTRPECSR